MKPVRLGPGSTIILALGEEGRIIGRWLERSGHRVDVASSFEECEALVERSTPDLVVTEVGIPDERAEAFIRKLKLRYPRVAVLVATDSQAVEHTVAAMQAGAYDYLVKPVDEVRLLTVAKTALAFHRLSTRVATLEREVKGEGFAGIIGRSAGMKRLYRQLDRVAQSDATVLVRGESGSGKELVARAIHEHSSRRDGAFVAVNCAAIPETLQESELFGHEKGAFTGATERRIGRFEQANGGTLFFDEVGELTPALQAKLLRVLQERRLHRVGGTEEVEVDVRVIAATHRDLEAHVAEGRFRQDLFYRIAVVELLVPPLREREGDVPLLAQTFLEGYDASSGWDRGPRSLDIPVLQTFVEYPWPGNVRELQNAVQRAAVLSDRQVLIVEDLPATIRDFARERGFAGAPAPGSAVPDPLPTAPDLRLPPADPPPPPDPAQSPANPPSGNPGSLGPDPERPYLPPGLTLSEVEEFAVKTAFERADGNVSKTARALGISRSVLYRKLDRFGIRSSAEDALDHADEAPAVGGDPV
jgi:DNA-binding NtrC family response regulator